MASIYDSYQIAQSQKARPYIGSTLPELRDLGNEMQRRYDTTTNNLDTMEMIRRQVIADPKSRTALEETLGSVNQSLQQYASRPDKENLVRPTTIMARDFASDAQVFMNNAKALQDYQEEIDKRTDVDRDTKEATKALAMMEYQGIKRDPATGKLLNRFTGAYTPPKSIDVPGLINKIGEGIKADAGGANVRQVSGDYYVEQGGEWKKVDGARVKKITEDIMAIDPEVRSYLNYQQMLSTKQDLYTNRITDINSIQDPRLQKAVQSLMDTGLTARQAHAQLRGQAEVGNIVNKLTQATIGKFAFHEASTSNKIMGKTEDATERDKEPLRFMVNAPSNMSTGELRGMNSSDLESRMKTTDQTIASQTEQLRNLIRTGAPASDVAQASAQLKSLQDQRTAASSVLDNTRNEAAKQLGYKDYAEFQSKGMMEKVGSKVDKLETDARGNVMGLNAQVYDAQGNRVSGAGLTKAQLKKALLDNQGEIVEYSPSSSLTPEQGNTDHWNIPLPGGGSVKLPLGSGFNKLNDLRGSVREAKVEFEKKTNQLFKDSKNLNYTTHQINLVKDKETEDIQRLYAGDPNAFTVYDRKGEKIVKQDDLPQGINITSVNVVKNGNGSVSLQAYTEDPKTKEREYYTVVPNTGNNIGSVLGARILKDAKHMTSPADREDLTKAAVNMMGNDWDGILANQTEINQDMPIRNSFGSTLGYIRKERSQANPKTIVYRLYNANGQPAMRPGANGMLSDISTSEIGAAANMVRGIIQNADQQQSK